MPFGRTRLILTTLAATIALAALSPAAHAATLYLQGVPLAAAANVTFHDPGTNATESLSNYPYTGGLAWTFDPAAPANAGLAALVPGGALTTFCIDGFQNVYIGQNNPLSGPAPLGGPTAAALSQFWDAHYADAFLSNVHSAAFQLGVWEIVADHGALDLTAGDFRASAVAGNAASAAALQQAGAWLATMVPAGPHYALYTLRSDTYQDQLFGVPTVGQVPPVPTPLPAALPMAAALAAGLGLARRVRRG
jgi:hypothetical protein